MEKKLTIAAVILVVLLLWMFRFDMQALPPGGESSVGVAYVLDRWTGNTHFLAPSFRRELAEPPATGAR